MSINRKKFYDGIRGPLYRGSVSQSQVDGIEAVLDEWDRRKLADLRWLAYMLATDYWETDRTMQPIREYGRGRGRPYGVPDSVTGQTYYGRGLVQLTWRDNYATMGPMVGADLLRNPDLALATDTAVKIMYEGMLCGKFTGMALKDCFNGASENWIKARAIINGTDRAQEIAGIGHKFHSALQAAS